MIRKRNKILMEIAPLQLFYQVEGRSLCGKWKLSAGSLEDYRLLAQSLNFLWRGNTYIQSRNKFCTKLHTILYTPNSVTTHSVMWNMNNLESWTSGAQKVSWYNGTTVQWRKLTHANTVNVILKPREHKLTLGCRSGKWAKRLHALAKRRRWAQVTAQLQR